MASLSYRPLNASKNEIRLFSIRQKPPHDDELLIFRMEHATLEEGQPASEYIAVSYTWGDATRRKEILIDDGCISVPEHAEAALRYLHRAALQSQRQKSKSRRFPFRLWTKRLRFWIDSVCINQSDLPKRGKQVAPMWRFYSSTTMVLV